MMTLRQSILGCYEQCPRLCFEQWGAYGTPDAQDGDIDEGLNSKYAGCGILFHEVMDMWAIQQIKGNEYKVQQLHDLFDVRFQTLDYKIFTDNDDMEKFYNSIHAQIDWIYDQFYKTKPTHSELKFNFDLLIEDLPGFEGTMDRIQGSFVTRDVDIIDYKTGKNYTKKEMNDNIQATIYSLAFFKLFGFYPKRFIFYFSKSKKIKEIIITEEFIEAGIARIKGIWYKILDNRFAPSTKNISYFCKNFCPSTTCKKKPKVKPKGWGSVGFEVFRPQYNIREGDEENEGTEEICEQSASI